MLFLKLHGQLVIALWHGFHLFDKETKIRLIPLCKGLLLDLLIFLLLQSVWCLKYSAKTSFSILNVFLRFLHQFVRTHFRIFVNVMRFKFHVLLKFSTRETLKSIFCHVAFYFHGLICWRLTYLCDYLFVFPKWYM